MAQWFILYKQRKTWPIGGWSAVTPVELHTITKHLELVWNNFYKSKKVKLTRLHTDTALTETS